MSLTRKIAQHTIIQVLGRALGLIAGVFVVGLLTRYLGQAGYGKYTTVIAFLQFFAIVADFGFYHITMQMISEAGADEPKIASNIFSLRFFFAFAILLMSCGISFLIPMYSLEIKLGICVASVAIFFILLNQILVAIYQKYIAMTSVAVSEFITRFLNLGIIFGVVSLDFGFYAVLFSLVIANGVNFLMNFINLQKLVKINFRFDFSIWKIVFERSWPIGLSIIFSMLYFKMDTIILSIFRSSQEVGIYGASYQLVEVLNSFPVLFVGLIMPILSEAWSRGDKEKFKHVLQKAFDSILIIVVPLVFGGFILARKLMILIAGQEFAISGDVLRILIFAVGCLFIGQLFGYTIVAIKQQKKMMWRYLWVAILGLTAYLIFIPQYSYYAAASITIVTEFLIAIFSMAIVYRELGSKLKINILWRAILSAVVMSLVINYLSAWHVLILIPLGGLIYFATLYLFDGLKKADILEIINYKK